jgi:hypothetical protein
MMHPIDNRKPTITRSAVMTVEESDRVDEWRREQRPGGVPTISAAIRQLIKIGLDVEEMKRSRKQK